MVFIPTNSRLGSLNNTQPTYYVNNFTFDHSQNLILDKGPVPAMHIDNLVYFLIERKYSELKSVTKLVT